MLTPVFNAFIVIFINLIIIFFKIIGKKKSILFCSYLFKLIGPKTKFNDIAQINLKYISIQFQ